MNFFAGCYAGVPVKEQYLTPVRDKKVS